MKSQLYSLRPFSIGDLLAKLQSNEIAIPAIQRPFVWKDPRVRDFIDSLYRGYPIGYIITWPKSGVTLRDGSKSIREFVLIDGQQRTMALGTALQGKSILDEKYEPKKICISFHPVKGEFKVFKKDIEKDPEWIPDISTVFNANTSYGLINDYCEKNQEVDKDKVAESIERLQGIRSNLLGVIELSEHLDVETVAEIFARINQKGVALDSADFIMSKMAASEQFNGHLLHKSIDYFCHLANKRQAYDELVKDDAFAQTDYFRRMKWLGKWDNKKIYVPDYKDMLRVVFTMKFERGDLKELVDRLSGKTVEESFHKLENGIKQYINETNFKRFIMILDSAGFIDASMTTAKNAVDCAYILYLTLRAKNVNSGLIEKLVRRWFVMTVLIGRYSRAPQSNFSEDIRGFTSKEGAGAYLEKLEQAELSDTFWKVQILDGLNMSGNKSVHLNVFLASQAKGNVKGFLSSDITVPGLFKGQKDMHHIFPKKYLQRIDVEKSLHNQLANKAVMQGEINKAIRDTEPAAYFSELRAGCGNGEPPYGGIGNLEDLQANFDDHCIPFDGVDISIFEDYNKFLEKRRKLIAKRIKDYYDSL